MATNLAIVYGEWQLDPDQEIRLYVRPTLTLIDRAGDTHYVPAFGYPYPRSYSVHNSTSGKVIRPTSDASGSLRARYRERDTASNKNWLESLTVHNLGELYGSPFMSLLAVRSTVCLHSTDMSDDTVCVEDAYAVSPYDSLLIEALKRIRIGNV